MKPITYLLFILSIILYSLNLSYAESKNILKQAHQEEIYRYNNLVDEIINNYARYGVHVTTMDLANMKLSEQEIIANINYNNKLITNRPRLFISEGIIDTKNPKTIAAQLLIVHLQDLGIEPYQDRLEGKTFTIPTSRSEVYKTTTEANDDKSFLDLLNPF